MIGKNRKTGTKITFMPDPEIFLVTREFKWELLAKRLRELAFLNPGIRMELSDERGNKSEIFQFKDGIEEYVAFLNRNKAPVHAKVIVVHDEAPADESKPDRLVIVDVALQYNCLLYTSRCV